MGPVSSLQGTRQSVRKIAMDPKRLQELTIKVDKASKVSLSIQYRAPNYRIDPSQESNISETGRLVLFRLEPLVSNLPTFVARWDQNKQTVDVDLIGDSIQQLLLKFGLAGYQGHHPTRVEEGAFKIDIRVSRTRICEGVLTFIANWSVSVADKLDLSDSVSQDME